MHHPTAAVGQGLLVASSNSKKWSIIGLILLGLSLVPLYYVVFQRSLIYVPNTKRPLRNDFDALSMTAIQVKTKDGLLLNAWYKRAKPKRPTVLVLHGNAGNIGTRAPLARLLMQYGYGVLLLEYRGYGGNSGKPDEQGLYLDAEAGMQYLEKHHVDQSQIVIYGESLGTGVATYLAYVSKNACAVILQSPYTTLAALARYHYPWIPITPWDKFDSISHIRASKVPVLILHGTEDKVVPFEEGQALFQAANEPKKFVVLENRGHSHLWSPVFLSQVSTFIDKYCQS